MRDTPTRYLVGQLVCHVTAGYRGVIVQADPSFQLGPEWYDTLAQAFPPTDRPWYRVLVDGADHETYVAERHLVPDASRKPIVHPHLGLFFDRFEDGRYTLKRLIN